MIFFVSCLDHEMLREEVEALEQELAALEAESVRFINNILFEFNIQNTFSFRADLGRMRLKSITEFRDYSELLRKY